MFLYAGRIVTAFKKKAMCFLKSPSLKPNIPINPFILPSSRRLYKMAKSVPVPFADLGKSTNDLLGKDFPVGQTKLELKTVAPNGVVCLSLFFFALLLLNIPMCFYAA